MKDSTRAKRSYSSVRRRGEATERRERILTCARELFASNGIDQVTVSQIADAADVSTSTIYSTFASKAGILQALMEGALFGERYQAVIRSLEQGGSSVDQIRNTARIARAIYESEADQVGLLRRSSAFAPSLSALEDEFEERRYDMQKERVEKLFREGLGNRALTLEEARRVLWTLTSREVFHKLVAEAGWSPDRYQSWLEEALISSLVASDAQ